MKDKRMMELYLKWRGRRDAWRGEPVVAAYIAKIIAETTAKEYGLAQQTENTLHPTRMKAAQSLTLQERSAARLQQSPPLRPASTPENIRANRTQTAEGTSVRNAGWSATDSIVEEHERIVRENTLLAAEIQRVRHLAMQKIDVYLTGVRSNKQLLTYTPEPLFYGNNAYEQYLIQHERLDAAVRIAAEAAWNAKKNIEEDYKNEA